MCGMLISTLPNYTDLLRELEEKELLRNFRDKLLHKTLEGQEIIRLYYEGSSVVVRAMGEEEEFKEEVMALISKGLSLWKRCSSGVWVFVVP